MAGPSGATPILNLPYPIPDDTVDVPRDIQALANALDAGRSVPVGSLLMWPTAIPPAGFLLCDGSVVSAATYPLLANVIAPVGGNITLPDLRDTFPVGAGATMGLASKGGEASHKLSAVESGIAAHGHGNGTLAVASHAHNLGSTHIGASPGSWVLVNATYGTGANNNNWPMAQGAATLVNDTATDAAAPGVTGAIAAAAAVPAANAHENRPPFLAVNFIIRAA